MQKLSRVVLIAALGWGAACSKTPTKQEAARSAPKPDASPDRTPPADAEKSPTGLASKLTKAGTGDKRPAAYDTVRVNFTFWNERGKLADSSAKQGGPVTWKLSEVIVGLAEGLGLMRVGEQRRLWVPDELGYVGRPGYPRGNSVYDIELLEIIDGVPPQPAPPDVAGAPSDAPQTSSGLAYKLLTQSGGTQKPNPWDRVTIHFTGWTTDGAMFDSSRSRKRPEIYDLPKVIPGWREAIPLLSVGDSVRLWVPEALAYQGREGEPKGSVVFDIELVSIQRQPEPPHAPADVAAAPRDAKRTRSGLAYRIVRRGEGKTKPSANDRVEVQYSAWTTSGELVDSSVVRGAPATLPISKIIPGWAEGLQLMAEGDKAVLWIPETLAYHGADGSPKGMLVYEVELLSVVK
ncbi:MAG TPA: FKBP-type peptidyl-prolyl cis-trans isomerase [Polyangiales bacterium]|nr:FKBP-type peptidyl-prolyl cis-trans isomerase [Polyangiales bacterium]